MLILSRDLFEMRSKLTNGYHSLMTAVTQEDIQVFEQELLTRYVDRVGAKRAKLVKTHTIGTEF